MFEGDASQPRLGSNVAAAFSSVADDLVAVLVDGDLDYGSHERLGALLRRVNTASARVAATSPLPPAVPDAEVGIDELYIDGATLTALDRVGLTTIAAVKTSIADSTLGEAHGIGPAKVADVEQAIARYDQETI